jgi:hypothetical protein
MLDIQIHFKDGFIAPYHDDEARKRFPKTVEHMLMGCVVQQMSSKFLMERLIIILHGSTVSKLEKMAWVGAAGFMRPGRRAESAGPQVWHDAGKT